ncbi:MAG: carboxylesterase/lipase family protein [Gammaproteobacteria bacterium]|nr:carboxylesterase/lipase family protein [Gammaproteobacteria bacterium]
MALPAAAARLVATSGTAVVRTTAGEIQGFVRDGILTFRGIPYATASRFMAPQPVPPWSGVRLTLSYGDICPQFVNPRLNEPQTFISDNRFWPASEECQVLNVWTPGVQGGARRPVMVWLHGGGFNDGAANSLAVYDGTRLSRDGDVVVVSVNHRLNVLGFLDLSAYGGKYRESANVGMLDIVAALRWVHDNIAGFGGDPGNVTIFGQSGGGAKVATLMAAPSARGLFHKAIIQSGAPGSIPTAYADAAVARRVAAATLREAGLTPDQVERLESLPYERLLAAANQALQSVGRELRGGQTSPGPFGLSWSPVVDGTFLPASPFAHQAPEVSRGIPLLMGSTLSEFQRFPAPALRGRERWSETEVRTYFQGMVGDRVDPLMAAFRKAYPHMEPREWPLVDVRFRSGVLRTAQLKALQGDPVYVYLFTWPSPVLDHAWAAGHSSELAFVFDNADLGVQSTGGGKDVDKLTRLMSQAWIHFARSGNPNAAGSSAWPMFTPERSATLLFDLPPRAAVGHDAELVRLLAD